MKLPALLIGLLVCGLAQAQASAGQPPSPGPDAPLRRIDDRRPAQPYRLWLGGTPVDLTGSWEYSDETRRNFDLDASRARNRRVREHELKLEARAALGETLSAFVQAVGVHETRTTQGTPGRQRAHAWQRGETWLQWDRPGGMPCALQLGRVALLERRSTWWDDELDAVRLRCAGGGGWRLDTGLGRELARLGSSGSGIAPEQQGVWRAWGQAGWQGPQRLQLEAFWLLVADRSGTPAAGSGMAAEPDTSDLQARWLGLRASGQWPEVGGRAGSRLNWWADTMLLRGRETLTRVERGSRGDALAGPSSVRRLRSWALDIGATLALGAPLRPSITVAYARASGGEDSATLDTNFRQTGLHENKARLAGVKRLRRYGELLQPDLSNLAVTTLGGGVRLFDSSSLELVLHGYRQLVPSTRVAAARLAADPQGLHRRLGREWDLVLALREWSWLELTFRLSRFEPGPAYAGSGRDAASALEVGAAVNF